MNVMAQRAMGMRTVMFVTGLLWLMATSVLALLGFYSAPAVSQGDIVFERERLENISEWSELCEVADCNQIPLDHATYVFGSTVYYFPNVTRLAAVSEVLGRGIVRPGPIFELDENGKLLRSFGSPNQLSISDCCALLLFYYGFEDSFPAKRNRDGRDLLPRGRLILSPHNNPSIENRVDIKFVGDVDEFSPIEEIIAPDTPSYNDDFWIVRIKDVDSRGRRAFSLLSKRPLLNGRAVYVDCTNICSFSTVSFAGDEGEHRPHVALRWVVLSRDNMFACTREEIETGCDPSVAVFDRVPEVLAIFEKMFEAAEVFPN